MKNRNPYVRRMLSRHVALILILCVSTVIAEVPVREPRPIPEVVARNGDRYANVVVVKRDKDKISFNHSDGISTLPLRAFDDLNLDRLFPGHLAKLKAEKEAAELREQERERKRDQERKRQAAQSPEAAQRAKTEDDIREVALRYVLTKFEPPDLTQVSAVLIEVDGDTPSEEFLARFAADKPPVRRFSKRRKQEIGPGEVLCSVSAPKWLSEEEVEIGASRSDGDFVAFRYILKRTAEGWKVVQRTITAIS